MYERVKAQFIDKVMKGVVVYTIKIENLTKRYGQNQTIKSINFTAKSGRITAFLGQNGAGKSSTLRILLGLDFATTGSATFDHKKYAEMACPLKLVGAAFDGVAGVPTYTVNRHLNLIARSNGIAIDRVKEVIELVGLTDKKRSKIRSLSLGEGQRLGIAVAILGNPQYLVFDEPTNGLDPAGMRWFRDFLIQQKKQGKTILLSSHLISEVAAMADDIVIIHKGEIRMTGELNMILREGESL